MDKISEFWDYRDRLGKKNKKYGKLKSKVDLYFFISSLFHLLGIAGIVLSVVAGSDKALAGAFMAAIALIVFLIAIYFKCKQYDCERDAYIELHKLSWEQIEYFMDIEHNEIKSLVK